MPEFISKLQYKTSEDGEYADEKARNLEETIDLIKNFPWAIEQYADLGITGPSITILDQNGNYLKAGIYYGGKYSLYFFDSKNHLYVRKNIKLDILYNTVNEFFAGKIDLLNFYKESFAFGIRKLFITNPFEYRIKLWKVLLLSVFWIYISAIFWFFSFNFSIIQPTGLFGLIPTLFAVIISWPLFKILNAYFKKKDQYLKISTASDIFYFGDSEGEIKAYHKKDIDRAIHYVNRESRSPNEFEIMEIIFKDGTSITFSNMLISYGTLSEKFTRKWNFKSKIVKQNAFKITWSL